MRAGHLVLIGYRGTGKSTVARRLSAALGRPMIDCDTELARRAGKSIREIFDQHGEEPFRDWESKVLADMLGRQAAVIATGGGVVLRPVNRELLAAAGTVVWLRATPETIVARLAADRDTVDTRPPLTDKDTLAEVMELLRLREPLYRSCAAEIVDTDYRSVDEVAADVRKRWEMAPPPGDSGPGESA